MSLAVLFWVTYVIVLLFGSWLQYCLEPGSYRRVGGHLAVMLLTGLLGWGVFGPIVK
jgi:hypothetical protein